ncbi:Plasmodium vivax Vir protein, putative [Plasmodium vivax]|uniref:Vir protein, putative n=1 Tax=Plasmodium vivax TaxID=5855 RepID=A0A1G4E3D2_PLAVI|nr:Plasmodium vivax Vir protein, putative [Plasmodium vivax]
MKTIFNYVSSFPQYTDEFERNNESQSQEIMDKCRGDHHTEVCCKREYVDHCKKAVQYINLLEKKFPSNKEGGCKFIIFWAYSVVLEKKHPKLDMSTFYKELKVVYHDLFKNETCNNYIEDLDENKFQKLKTLGDLYENFEKFKTGNSYRGGKCTYASNCVNIYMEQFKNCEEENNTPFCEELEKFREKYNDFMKNKTNCEVRKILPSTRKPDIKVILFPVATLMFTPMFSCLRTKKRKVNNSNLCKENNSLRQTYESQRINSNNEAYHISYNSG